MASGVLDLFFAKLPNHNVVLTLNGSDSTSELLAIPRNTAITLKRGNIKQNIELQFLEGRECFADFMEMNYALARQFQLKALRRYLLTYDPSDHSITIQPSPRSVTTALLLTSSTLGSSSLSVGYELLSKLGIPERQGTNIKLRQGNNMTSLRLHVPANLSDDRLLLPTSWVQKWRLRANQRHLLQFDQRNFILSMSPYFSSSR